MARTVQSALPATLVFALLLCVVAVFAGPTLRHNDTRSEIKSVQHRTYPRRTADLEKWLQREISTGQTKREDVISIFGTKYYHPWVGFDPPNRVPDASKMEYDLGELGILDPDGICVLCFEFDAKSGELLRARVMESEMRQTGYNINVETGTQGRP